MIRLRLADDQPLAVQQWQGLIAVNYPARRFGIGRFLAISEAKKLCPQLILQHVATWTEGDDEWAYREDSYKHVQTDKVSLDPYRLQSRRILATIKDVLPAPPVQKVEKASIDEVFLDLSAQIYAILLGRYPELEGPPPYDDPTENLPFPPSTVLSWQADALIDLDDSETEDDDPDWDDICMLIGSEIVREVRQSIRERLKYTCSAGIARNKMMAKLGSGHKKPNAQTVVRNRAIQHFLSGFKFTKIRNLGGKLGDQIISTFGTEELTELLSIALEQFKSKLGDDTGTWLYGVIRGEDTSEVNSRTQIQSMLSAKSFRPAINTYDQAVKWLRIFVADIYARLVEEGVVENRRRPKTMNLHHRQGAQTRSRQIPIPQGRKIDAGILLELAKTLLGQIIVDGRAWPCRNLSLSVGGFEDGVTGNRGIGSFLVKGEEAKTVNSAARSGETIGPSGAGCRPEKRRKTADDPSMYHSLVKNGSTSELDEETGSDHVYHEAEATTCEESGITLESSPDRQQGPDPLHQPAVASFLCKECKRILPSTEEEEHKDWHFAKNLQTGDSPAATGSAMIRLQSRDALLKPGKGGHSNIRGGSGKPEKGQKRLAFG